MASLLSKYLEIVIQQNKYIDARGVMQVSRMIELSMEEIFVSLTARLSKGNLAINSLNNIYTSRFINEQLIDTQTIENISFVGLFDNSDRELTTGLSLENIWMIHSHWAMLGDPGSGKTTILKHLALSEAKKIITDKSGYLPIFITLRYFAHEWNKNLSWDINTAIVQYITGPLLEDMGFNILERNSLAGQFEERLRSGSVMLLCDGLDEQRDEAHGKYADTAMKAKTVDALDKLLKQYPGNRCMVTSRVVGYNTASLKGGFQTAIVEPFNNEQLKIFYRNWFKAIEKHEDIIQDGITEKKALEKADGLVEHILKNAGLRELATNPLLSTIIALIYRQGAALPQKRVELYKLCIDTFIFNWEMHKHKQGIEQVSLDKDETQAVLEEIAIYMHEHTEENRLSEMMLFDVITKYLVAEQGLQEYIAREKAARLLDLIKNVAGLLIDKGSEEYGFLHLTFQEYLAARYITSKKKFIDNYLSRYLYNPRWREVVRLAAAHQGMKDEESGGEFIAAILRCRHQRDNEMEYSFRIAFRCMRDTRVEMETCDAMFQKWINNYFERPELKELYLRLISEPKGDIRYRESTLKLLFEAAENSDVNIRSAAITALGELKDARAMSQLIQALKDVNQSVRRYAARALGKLEDLRVVEPLMQMFKDADESVQRSAAVALRESKNLHAFDLLLQMLNDEDEIVRGNVARALGLLNHSRAFDPLLKLFKDKSISVQRDAIYAAGRVKDYRLFEPFLQKIKDEDSEIRAAAIYALANLQDARAYEPIIQMINDRDALIRGSVAFALGVLEDKRAVTPLIKILKDKADFVRESAAEGLGWLNDSRAVEPLILALNDKKNNVRRAAITALGQLKDSRAVEPLLQNVNDSDHSVKQGIGFALGQLRDSRAFVPLLQMLQDNNSDVRSAAATALGQLKDSRAVEPLLKLFKDKDIDVRISAARSIELIDMGAII